MPSQGLSFTCDYSSCARDTERTMRQQVAGLWWQNLCRLKIERHESRCHVPPLSHLTITPLPAPRQVEACRIGSRARHTKDG